MNKTELTTGNITKKLAMLAFPIMGTSFLQMAYNLVDMIWIGKLGPASVAAVGTAGYFMWLSFALISLTRVGAEVKVAQHLGAGEVEKANEFGGTAMIFGIGLGLIYGLALIFGRSALIGFFAIDNTAVVGLAKVYLAIVAISMPFSLFNQVISALYNASGQSKLPFRANGIGLLLNIILDPVLIFVFDMGVVGAAVATTLAQVFVSAILLRMVMSHEKPYIGFHLGKRLLKAPLVTMLKISWPVALQSGLFTIISIFVARIIASHGMTAIAVQKVGTQIEAITYMTASGFGVALSAMVGQNYGADKMDRVKDSFKSAFLTMGLFGIFTGMLMFFGARPIFGIFLNQEPALTMGAVYLGIISWSQVFMCLEITMAGGLNGLGKSLPPAVVGIVFNALRIPAAYYLSTQTPLGINGIWWAISVSSMFKGTVLMVILLVVLIKIMKSNSKAMTNV